MCQAWLISSKMLKNIFLSVMFLQTFFHPSNQNQSLALWQLEKLEARAFEELEEKIKSFLIIWMELVQKRSVKPECKEPRAEVGLYPFTAENWVRKWILNVHLQHENSQQQSALIHYKATTSCLLSLSFFSIPILYSTQSNHELYFS